MSSAADGVVFHVTLLPDDPENDTRCCFRLEAELAATASKAAKLPYWVRGKYPNLSLCPFAVQSRSC